MGKERRGRRKKKPENDNRFVNIDLDENPKIKKAINALAKKNGRTLRHEVIHGLRRYCITEGFIKDE